VLFWLVVIMGPGTRRRREGADGARGRATTTLLLVVMAYVATIAAFLYALSKGQRDSAIWMVVIAACLTVSLLRSRRKDSNR
jgi:cytochrome c oxidase assembly factor CtaG